MATVTIDVDSSKNEIYLSGDIKALQHHRFAWRYARDYLHPTLNDDCLVIKIGEADTVSLLSKIHEMLTKYGFEETRSDSSERVLADFFEEERKFSVFSEKARHIRNNECVVSEFNQFVDLVSSNLSARTLYPLQLLSAYHLAFSQNACNFSVPGAGKTSIVYGAYAYLHALPKENPKHVDYLLIVGPLSSFGPWELEYKECFGRIAHAKRLISGLSKEDKRDYLYSKSPSELTLISYASVLSLKDDL